MRDLSAHQLLTTLLVWPHEGVNRWNIVLGTQYPPAAFVGVLTASSGAASATVEQSFTPQALYNSSATKVSLERMTMTTIVRLPSGDVACGLFVGNYFDGKIHAQSASPVGSRIFQREIACECR